MSLSSTGNLTLICSCCGDGSFSNSMDARFSWRYFRCGSCGGVQLAPVPNEAELEKFYNLEYKVEVDRHLRQMAAVGRRMLDLLEAKTQGRRLLEIGCSYGGFLRLAKHRGWSCTGIEASRTAAAEAASAGLEVYAGTLQSNLASLSPRKFDVIALWHVIEHVPDAKALLRLASTLLAPGGYVTLRTPNAESLGARLLGQRWEWFYAPEHVFLYSARGMRLLLGQCNFEIESISSQRGDARTLLSQAVSALGSFAVAKLRQTFLDQNGQSKNPRRLRTLHRQVASITDVAGRPIDSMLGLNGRNLRGSELAIIARNNAQLDNSQDSSAASTP